jgi:hypothetical protein
MWASRPGWQETAEDGRSTLSHLREFTGLEIPRVEARNEKSIRLITAQYDKALGQ